MKIVVTAGGGGHFSPALAVMRKLPKEANILFIGRKHAFEGDKAESFEYKTVHELKIPFEMIITGRLQRTVSLYSFTSLLKIPYGFLQSLRILTSFRPDVVFSTGGYVTLPVTIAARILDIPVVIHEQARKAGLANRIAGKFARKICISWESSVPFFPPEKTVLTGNTFREAFLHPPKKKFFPDPLPIIYITGGSLGSHAMNHMVEEILEKLLSKFNIFHQTGDAQAFKDYERLRQLRESLPEKLQKRYYLTKFVSPDEVATILRMASLVISRSGINTLTEILYFEKPALLIPLPHGQTNEQRENARFLEELGLARVKEQEELTPETLYTEIEKMMSELELYKVKQADSSGIQKDATEKIITTLLSVAKEFSPNAHKKTES